jgi:hypothetical protein
MLEYTAPPDQRAITSPLTLELDGEQIDGRSQAARRFKRIAHDLTEQLGRSPKASEMLLLRNASTLAYLCDRDTARLMAGATIDEENYRRNAQALGAALIKLGMASKSRDVTKRSMTNDDPFADAINAVYEIVT